MSRILEKALSLDETEQQAVDNYFEDILVNEDVVDASTVIQRLMMYKPGAWSLNRSKFSPEVSKC